MVSHAVEPVYSFEIPRQTADGALTALGEQADISVLYRYEMVVKHETNQLKGSLYAGRCDNDTAQQFGLEC